METSRTSRGPRLLLAANLAYFFEQFLEPYARRFRSLGFGVDALVRSSDREALAASGAYDAVHGADWPRARPGPWQALRSFGAVRAVLGRGGYDIVHVHTPIASWMVRRAASLLPGARRPGVVYTAHGFYFHGRGPLLRNAVCLGLESWAAPWHDRLVVLNREDRAAALRHGLCPPDRLALMPGIGVDTERFAPRAGPPADPPVFLCIAEFTPEKRQADAVRALSLLDRTDARLVLAGEQGPYADRVRRMARDHGVADRVEMRPFAADVRPLLRDAAALLLPSEREGLSRAVMEAQCMEVPVIGSDARGVADLLEPAGAAVHRVGDIPGLARHMAALLRGAGPGAAALREGRRRMEREHGLGRLLGLHEILYEGLLRERGLSPRPLPRPSSLGCA